VESPSTSCNTTKTNLDLTFQIKTRTSRVKTGTIPICSGVDLQNDPDFLIWSPT
jgi:hypothetical protein